MSFFFDLIRFTTPTTGQISPVVVGANIPGCRTILQAISQGAVIPDGTPISYSIFDTPNYETGTGIVGSGGTTMTRDVVVSSSAGTGTRISLSGVAQVSFAVIQTDLAALTAINDATLGSAALGDTLYASGINALARLAGNATAVRKFMRQTGNGSVSAAPAWDTLLAADVPASALTVGSDTNVTLTLGGTPASALLAPASVTAGWTGRLAFSRLTQVLALSVLGVGGVATADAAAITGAAAQVLRVNNAGTALAFGAVDLSQAAGATGLLQPGSFPALTGDVTTAPGALATTLATVNGNVGSFGSSTAIPNFTVNAKGLLTAAGTNPVIAPAGTLTGTTLAANVVNSSLTSVGTLVGGAVPWALVTGAPAIPGLASPSVLVGLAAKNGSANTAMRSDGAPALDQSITPTWTGLHTFNAGIATAATTSSSLGVIRVGSAPFLHSYGGGSSVFLGSNAGNFSLTGSDVVAIGNGTGAALTTAAQSVFVGSQAGAASTSGSYNVGIGYGALNKNPTDGSTAVGYCALFTTTTGSRFNTAFGFQALYGNTTGQDNNAIGYDCLSANTTGSENNAIGYQSMGSNATGSQNTAHGSAALFANVSANNSCAFGYRSLSLSTGPSNVGMGANVLSDLTTGSTNVAVGYNTGRGLITGSNNTIIGAQIVGLPAALANAVVIGDSAGNIRADYGLTKAGWTMQGAVDIPGILTAEGGGSRIGGGLTSSGVIVPASAFFTGSTGAVNFGVAGGTSIEFLNACHLARIRQNGLATQFKMYIPVTTGITGFFFKIWRARPDGNFDLIATSGDLSGSLVAGTTNTLTLATPIAVQEGDYTGIRAVYGGGSSVFTFTITPIPIGGGLSTVGVYYINNASPVVTPYNWTSQTQIASFAHYIEVDMAAPVMVFVGDSITSGTPNNASFCDNYNVVDNIQSSFPFKLGHALRYTYQNMGIGGETSTGVASLFSTTVVSGSPRLAVIAVGVNDILGGTTNATVLANFTTMLNQALSAGITPVVVGVLPFRGYSSATNTMLQQRDLLNAALKTLVTGSPYFGFYVNSDPYIGQFYPTGDAGNLWMTQPAYTYEGLHLSTLGRGRVAQAICDAIGATAIQASAILSDATVNGDISINGDTDRSLWMARNTANISFGYNYLIAAGGSTVGSTDQNGGSLILSGGVATGAGQSSVLIQAAAAGSSGQADASPAVVFGVVGGRVGISSTGTVTPAALLDVEGAGGIILNAGNVGIGNTVPVSLLTVGQVLTNAQGSIYEFGYGAAESLTSPTRAGNLLQSNDAANPFVMSTYAIGAASAANRIGILQTGQDGLSFGGGLVLQGYGGKVGIGSVTVPTSMLTVNGQTAASGGINAVSTVSGDFIGVGMGLTGDLYIGGAVHGAILGTTVSATSFILNNFTYQSVAVSDGSGSFGGGYNLSFGGTTPKTQVGGAAASAIYYRTDGSIFFYNGPVAAAATNIPLSISIMSDGGLLIGAASGNSKGAGTINVAGGIYLNNTAYTNPDYAFEHYFMGKIERFAAPLEGGTAWGNKRRKTYPGLMPLPDLMAFVRSNLRLPGIDDDPTDAFERADIALEKIEEQAIYIIQLHERLEELEEMVKCD